MPLEARIADALRAADAETSWRDVSHSLHALDPDGEDPTVRPFYFAFFYTLLERTSPRRDQVGSPFGSWSAGEGWRFPPDVSTIEDVVHGSTSDSSARRWGSIYSSTLGVIMKYC